VHKNALPAEGFQLGWPQFIERTEMVGCRREKAAERFKDNPRQLGKGHVRLVGLTPLKSDRKAALGGRIHQFLWQRSRAVSNAK